MPYNPNDPNYQTKNSRVMNFNDFSSNIRKEEEELQKQDRSYTKNSDEIHAIPGNTTKKYNKVTKKLDDLTQAEVKDKIKSIEELGVKPTKHKYKLDLPKNESKN